MRRDVEGAHAGMVRQDESDRRVLASLPALLFEQVRDGAGAQRVGLERGGDRSGEFLRAVVVERSEEPGGDQLQSDHRVPPPPRFLLIGNPNSGMIMPRLGIVRKRPASGRKSLADALFTRTQQRVFGVLFGQPDRSFYASELIRTAGTGSGAAQRELARLENSGLLVSRRVGHQKHYQANAASPLFAELRSIVLKTVALAEPLRTSLKPLSSSIRAAFVYGSVAKATDRATSDIDLMIVSDSLTYGEVFGVLERVTKTLGRQVNPTVYTAAEFSKRSGQESAFVTRVLEQPKVWIIGGEDDLPVAA
jgi:predicted nucleotidyltransferase